MPNPDTPIRRGLTIVQETVPNENAVAPVNSFTIEQPTAPVPVENTPPAIPRGTGGTGDWLNQEEIVHASQRHEPSVPGSSQSNPQLGVETQTATPTMTVNPEAIHLALQNPSLQPEDLKSTESSTLQQIFHQTPSAEVALAQSPAAPATLSLENQAQQLPSMHEVGELQLPPLASAESAESVNSAPTEAEAMQEQLAIEPNPSAAPTQETGQDNDAPANVIPFDAKSKVASPAGQVAAPTARSRVAAVVGGIKGLQPNQATSWEKVQAARAQARKPGLPPQWEVEN